MTKKGYVHIANILVNFSLLSSVLEGSENIAKMWTSLMVVTEI